MRLAERLHGIAGQPEHHRAGGGCIAAQLDLRRAADRQGERTQPGQTRIGVVHQGDGHQAEPVGDLDHLIHLAALTAARQGQEDLAWLHRPRMTVHSPVGRQEDRVDPSTGQDVRESQAHRRRGPDPGDPHNPWALGNQAGGRPESPVHLVAQPLQRFGLMLEELPGEEQRLRLVHSQPLERDGGPPAISTCLSSQPGRGPSSSVGGDGRNGFGIALSLPRARIEVAR